MADHTTLTRRRFLAATAAGTGALVLGFQIPSPGRFGGAIAAGHAPTTLVDGWLVIGTDNSIVVRVASSEMGQGVYTAMPMLIAEELEVGMDQIRAEMAPVGKAFTNLAFNMQATGGSTSIRWSYEPLRKVGAHARELLRAAAAQTWKVPAGETRAERGEILHPASGRRASSGQLAALAAGLTLPSEAPLKPKSEWKLLGKPTARLDTPLKTTGRADFGIDVKLDGMLVGTVAASPVFGGKLTSVDRTPAMNVKGVRDVISLPDAVVVVADGYWAAKKGLAALDPQWAPGDNAGNDNDRISALLHAGMNKQGAQAAARGDAAALDSAARKLSATYEAPLLAHSTMEPMNATADVRADGVDLWLPTQAPGIVPGIVAQLTGVAPEQVRVHTTFLGGGFGRRFEMDFMVQAVLASKAAGAPVKLIWSREEDTRHDFYRPPSVARLRGGLDAAGKAVALDARIASPSIFSRVFPQFVKDGVDSTAVEGIADSPYGFPNFHTDYVMQEVGVPVGFWRSVGHSQNAFFLESFIDEMAHAAGRDPLDIRRELLAGNARHLALVERLARESGWGKPGAGRSQGMAVHHSFGTTVGQVMEVSVSGSDVRVHKVTCVVDCGTFINPDTIHAQVESSIVYGLTAAFFGEINVRDGAVVEGNFDAYRMLRMAHMPAVDTHIMANDEAPGGMGEPALPPAAPALANAIFAATGKRYRSLPLARHGLSPASA